MCLSFSGVGYRMCFSLSIIKQWNFDYFNEVAGDRPNLFVKWRVCYIKNLDTANLRGKDQNVHYI